MPLNLFASFLIFFGLSTVATVIVVALKGDSDMFSFTFCYHLWTRKSDSNMGCNTEKKLSTWIKTIRNKEVENDNLCKVGVAITILRAIEKSPIM